MREILFRAKAINHDPDKEYRTNYKNGDWVYGFVTKLYNAEYNSPAEMKTLMEQAVLKLTVIQQDSLQD